MAFLLDHAHHNGYQANFEVDVFIIRCWEKSGQGDRIHATSIIRKYAHPTSAPFASSLFVIIDGSQAGKRRKGWIHDDNGAFL